jgi:tetratricopeptide (TPR) repeat protein
MLYLQEHEYDRAVSEFRLVTSAKPDDIAAHYYLSLALDELKRYDEAIDELKKILAQDPKNLNAFLTLAFIYTKLNRLSDAAQVYDELLTFDQTKPEIFSQLGNIYIQAKDYEKAEEVLKRGLQLFKDNDDLYFTAAVLDEKIGRFDDMVASLKKVIEINPKHADALNYLGFSYADKGIHLQEALSLIQKALDLKPDSGYIIDSLGWVYFKLGKQQEALKYLRKALESVKDDPVLYEHLGDVYEAMGNPNEALAAWNNSLKFHEKEEGVKERVEEKVRKLKAKYGIK